MGDSCCVVCAEVATWVAYGGCGHVDVCSTCIARLRFVCHDRTCCICKSPSPFVFVTKALGARTKVLDDFSILPAAVKDGKLDSYWFHEGIQAYFDDFDAYKIVKDMCKLSCTVCQKSEAEGKTSKRTSNIKNIEQLKDHLSRRHELFFCSLCLANKKVFICEQKLYSRLQLRQHIRYGDSEADGCESERCGFSGHPFCEYCQTPFYGDNELSFHMSTEHYTCHICQREHPTQYKYYMDYNDLEIHFREAHFLCEDDECLDKKFIVFDTEADMKSHAALEHGGNTTVYGSNVALQVPTCFGFEEREECNLESNQISSATSSISQGPSLNFPPNASEANSVPSSGGTSLDYRGVLLNAPTCPPRPTTSKRRRSKSKTKNTQQTSQNTLGLLHEAPSLPIPEDSSHSLSSSNADGSHFGPTVSLSSRPMTFVDSSSSSSVKPSTHLNLTSSGPSSVILSSNNIKHVGSSSAFDSVDGGERSSRGDDVQSANKSLVDSIQAALDFDPDKFSAFKIISKEYRDGKIQAREYLCCVHQFGLEHLILDLARLCSDQEKQKELMDISKSMLEGFAKTGLLKESDKKGGSTRTKKGKEKCEDSKASEGLLNHMKEMKVSVQPYKELSISNGLDRTAKGKSKIPALTEMSKILPPEMPKILHPEPQSKDVAKTPAVTEMPEILPDDDVGCSNSINGGGKKKLKKNSKFLKIRLGERSASMLPNLGSKELNSDLMVVRPNHDSILASVCGVWRNSEGRRMVTITEASPCSR